MTIIAFIVGISLPTACGMLLVSLLEGKKPVLFLLERFTLGFTLGLTFTMFLVTMLTVTLHIPLAPPLFLGVHIVLLAVLLLLRFVIPAAPLTGTTAAAPSHRMARWVKIVLGILLGWTAIKIIVTSVVFLLLSPTYLDDTLTNWDLRGKVFYVDQALTLVMPNEDPSVSPQGVSSYPPTVPLAKTWLSVLAGSWNEGLVNSIHVLWYLCALALVFCAIRRVASLSWALLGVYVLGSMPLYLMHGVNAYADAFMSVHVLIAVMLLFFAWRSDDAQTSASLLRLAAFAAAILAFTKNEGVVVYLPPLLLLTLITLVFLRKKHRSRSYLLRAVIIYVIAFACLALPWLLFKWSHHLSFGNGKPFTSLALGWQAGVLTSIYINTFFEGNWLLFFPLFFILLIWRFKAAAGPFAIITAFFLIIYLGQGALYLFTKLSLEALKQTGYARGLVQLMPTTVVLLILLLRDALLPLRNTLAIKTEIGTD